MEKKSPLELRASSTTFDNSSTSFLFKDPTVRMNLHFEHPAGTWRSWRSWGNRYLWLRLTGPGRVAVQSNFEPMEDPGSNLDSCEPHTTSIQW
jgi:hypothetical protein